MPFPRYLTAVFLLALTVALTGCSDSDSTADSGPEQAPASSQDSQPDPATSEPTKKPTKKPTKRPTKTPEAPAPDDIVNAFNAASANAPWMNSVTGVTVTEPGRLQVDTSIVDPRGDSGSTEAQEAIAICEAAVEVLEADGTTAPYVSVMEADGTTYVLYGHPAYPDGCTEV